MPRLWSTCTIPHLYLYCWSCLIRHPLGTRNVAPNEDRWILAIPHVFGIQIVCLLHWFKRFIRICTTCMPSALAGNWCIWRRRLELVIRKLQLPHSCIHLTQELDIVPIICEVEITRTIRVWIVWSMKGSGFEVYKWVVGESFGWSNFIERLCLVRNFI